MSRKLIIAANWKMNKGPSETGDFLKTFLAKVAPLTSNCDVVVAPPLSILEHFKNCRF